MDKNIGRVTYYDNGSSEVFWCNIQDLHTGDIFVLYEDEDIQHLYSNKHKDKSSQDLNSERQKLYDEYTNLCKDKLLQLNNIIQNPIPISADKMEEWNRARKEAMERLNELLVQIESFVYLYHIEEEF